MRTLLFGIAITVALVIATWSVEPTVGEISTSCLGQSILLAHSISPSRSAIMSCHP
jgi:hypothetical protein